jgi:2-dehydro-3-deoxy-D-arabinonate dehydratase
MNLFRYLSDDGPRLGLETAEGRFDLTGLNDPAFASLAGWLSQPDPAEAVRLAAYRVMEPVPDDAELLAPLDAQEVWAAGVTYERSKVARMEESESGGDFYDKVYAADRPELFFKSLPRRVSAPGQPVRIRKDSTWDVPEPEMTLVISAAGNIVGVTVGNDMSSRSIEGENPLYLPQAKSYDGAAAVGPVIRIVEDAAELRNLVICLKIERGGQIAFEETTSTARMKRTPEELVGFLFRETTFPDGVFLMTGTGLVPPDSFTLQSGDIVSITIEGIGTLTNPVA